ncbi:glycosyltransferase family 2 protein [Aerococcus urinaeequi]
MKKISVIIPVFNSEKYLVRCLESVLNQTYQNIEIIIVNDGSTDNSQKILDQFSKNNDNITLLTQINKGQSSARNLGIVHAKGDYIGFVDSDDWIHPEMYNHLVTNLEKNSADISSAQMITVKNNDKIKFEPIQNYRLIIETENQMLVNYLYNGQNKKNGQYSAARKLFKKEVLKEVSFLEGYVYEDMLFNFEALEHSNRHIISDAIVYYYYLDNDSTMRGRFIERDLDLLYISDKIIAEAKKYPSEKRLIKLAEMKKARDYFTLLMKLLKNGSDMENEKIDKIQSQLVNGIRKNYWLLIESPLKFTAKLTATLLALNPKWVKKIFK